MFRSFLLFLWLFILILFWVYIFWDAWEDTQLDTRYSQYLSGALVRNTPSYNVKFDTSLFIPQQRESSQEFIEKLNESEFNAPSQNNTQLLSYEQESQEENTSSKGNFWTPTIPDPTDAELSGLCDGGLIYDPCIVLWKPIRAYGGMNFGSQKYN